MSLFTLILSVVAVYASTFHVIHPFQVVVPAPAPAPAHLDLGPQPPGLVFDVTHHGAVSNGETESSMGFLGAWYRACDHGATATFYVPKGKYFVGPLQLSGPCFENRSPNIVIRGDLIAPSNLDAFPSKSWIEIRNLNDFTIIGELGKTHLDAQGSVEAWKQKSCHKSANCKKLITSLKLSHVSNGTIFGLTLSNAKGFHVGIHESQNVNIDNVAIRSPGDSPNTDGIHVSRSTNVSIISSIIGVGDDCISIGDGSVNIAISNVSCGPGHGISVGSLGRYKNEKDVVGIRVKSCRIHGTQNGIRIKTWPGSLPSKAYNMSFEDIEMVNVSNPIIIDQHYCPHGKCNQSKASQVKLKNISFKNVKGTYRTNFAVTLMCSPTVACKNIKLVDINLNAIDIDEEEEDNDDDDHHDDEREGRLKLKGAFDGLQVTNSKF